MERYSDFFGSRAARASMKLRATGARFAYKNVMLGYHCSTGIYDDFTVPTPDIPGVTLSKVQVREKIHTPGVTISVTPQLSLWIEHPIWKRHMEGTTLNLPARPAVAASSWPRAG